jgi:hypothetical protein
MKFELRERDRRALLFLGIAVIVYVFLSMLAIPVFDSLLEGPEIAAVKQDQLMRYRRALVRKGHYAQTLVQARKNAADAEARLVQGDNPSLASVEFQTIVEEAARKLEINLTSRNMSAPRKKDDFFNELTMTIAFECTPNQLVTFLSEIRSAPKFITVRNSQIAPVRAVHEAPKDEDFVKAVRVNLTLTAILSSPPVPPKG